MLSPECDFKTFGNIFNWCQGLADVLFFLFLYLDNFEDGLGWGKCCSAMQCYHSCQRLATQPRPQRCTKKKEEATKKRISKFVIE